MKRAQSNSYIDATVSLAIPFAQGRIRDSGEWFGYPVTSTSDFGHR
jgi:hypothetical protein